MGTRPLVVLLDSVLTEGIAVSLVGNQLLAVACLDAHAIDVRERLHALKPDLVIFELHSPRSPCILPLLWEQPGVPLIGLDLTCSRAVVLDSRQLDNPTLDDVCRMIQTKVSESVRRKEGAESDTIRT